MKLRGKCSVKCEIYSTRVLYIVSWMNSKGQRGNCIYNQHWEVNSKYKGWLTAFKADRKMALCKYCVKWSTFQTWESLHWKLHMKSEGTKTTVELKVNRLWHYPHLVLYHVEMGIQLKQEKWDQWLEVICEKT